MRLDAADRDPGGTDPLWRSGFVRCARVPISGKKDSATFPYSVPWRQVAGMTSSDIKDLLDSLYGAFASGDASAWEDSEILSRPVDEIV